MRVRLSVQTGKAKGQKIEIPGPRYMIGRDPRCQLRPNNPTISRLHALIEQREGKVFVRDLGTSNGTKLNDRMLHGEEAEAAHGDRLEIGPLVFALVIERGEPKPALAAATPLIEEGDPDAGERTAYNLPVEPAPEAPAARPAPPPSPPAEPAPAEEAPGEPIPLKHLQYGVVENVLVIRIQTPELTDESTVAPIRHELRTLFDHPLPRQVVISLAQVNQLSSRAVGMLLAHFQRLTRARGIMRLCEIQPDVMAVLEQMRLPLPIEIFPNLNSAIHASWE